MKREHSYIQTLCRLLTAVIVGVYSYVALPVFFPAVALALPISALHHQPAPSVGNAGLAVLGVAIAAALALLGGVYAHSWVIRAEAALDRKENTNGNELPHEQDACNDTDYKVPDSPDASSK